MKHTTHLLNKPGKKTFSALLLFQLCFSNISAQNTKDTSSVKTEIMILNQQMEEAFNNNDMNKVAAFYVDGKQFSQWKF